ncbi:MAG TPA: hypothetical protein DD381_14170 [Lentisphaeria bacterium]|nr:MAG: hypothetical protein A2X47_01095 [Lentisphaerae bacterium GWF2_38_69]HBM17470.1 hypothetical protein [Lentisphaeria bacterium]
MKNDTDEINRCLTIDDSDCYKYSSGSEAGNEVYYIASRDDKGKILRKKVSKADFLDSKCRFVYI